MGAQNDQTWLGNISGAAAPPIFTSDPLPVAVIPSFDANKIGSETFDPERLPVAVGVGPDHASGVVPDPGSPFIDATAQVDDYLARDMTYRPMKPISSYQPQIAPPAITLQSYYQGQAYVNITMFSTIGTHLFYRIEDGPFIEIITNEMLPILVPIGAVVGAYSAKAGYDNSEIAMYTIPPSPTG
jgi:hypothetical protein